MPFKPIQKFISSTLGINTGISVEKLKKQYSTPESKYLDFEGMKVHYRITGKGPALLLVHGIGSSLHTWSEYHKILSKKFTVISLDTPGFGLTGKAAITKLTFDLINRCFIKLLHHLSLDKVHMVGNSLGGIYTWKFALAHPDRLNKIVLMNSCGFNTNLSELSDVGFRMSIHPLTKTMSQYVTPMAIIKSTYGNTVYDQSIVTEEKLKLYQDLFMREGNRVNFSYILKNLIVNGADHSAEIKSIATPTLIMWGEEDNLINVGDAHLFHRAISKSKLIIYKKIGHLPMEENPKQSAADIQHFLLAK